MDNFNVKLLKRSLGQKKKHISIKPLYADRRWAEDLDIVNELGGHTGCVNALSWSTSGRLLASGSDDLYLNIWDYNPVNQAKPFTLNTSVSTGHSNNIFSVKFMPHSNDRTVVTCAGDSEVRVFDLEYGGIQNSENTASTSTRSRRFNNFFGSVRWLNEGNTNARVYRSHADRAKRIVTESSPHLFLTCSEDGEVRQWDLRQPSSAYPPPTGMRRMGRFQTVYNEDTSSHAPPPLISYKKYSLDLNSISCSGSQPHYIALGGAHLHCFLHDRRMLGRNISHEQGRPSGFNPTPGSRDDEMMREATKCVRRFAPNDKQQMKVRDQSHITACKISNARPNELIASWSGDHIYSFDIVKSPDAKESDLREDQKLNEDRLRNQMARKRKRGKTRQSTSSHADRSRPKSSTSEDTQNGDDHAALQVVYGNGETENIRIEASEQGPEVTIARARDTFLSEAQKQAERVARSLVQLRKTLFDFTATIMEEDAVSRQTATELTPFTSTFTKALGQAASLLPEMDEIIRTWTYPINPTEEQVEYQNTLRRNRQSAWRFVQAAGALSATLGGRLQSLSSAEDPRMSEFDMIKPASREGRRIEPDSRFYYDFLKAILLWLRGGVAAVLGGFTNKSEMRTDSVRFPLALDDAKPLAIEKLRRYFQSIAPENPLIDLATNRFERDELRHVFPSCTAAVEAFIRALSGTELELDQGMSEVRSDASTGSRTRVIDRGAAARFWVLRVGRSLLIEAAHGVTYSFVQHAFGGPHVRVISEVDELGHLPHTITVENDHEETSEALDLALDFIDARAQDDVDVDEQESDDYNDGNQDDDDDDDDEDDDDDDDDDSDDHRLPDFEANEAETSLGEDSEDGGPTIYRNRTPLGRIRERANVNLDVPYSSHNKIYKGHCNTRTVKDVNYYGLDDEYVVSGSDDGHFFIWDRKTCQIVNILEGDGEIVNVVQGHPYEPMIACSGLDSTVKIFGPAGNNRERYRASQGIDVANPGGGTHSSLRFGRRRRNVNDNDDNMEEETNTGVSTTAENEGQDEDDIDEDEPTVNVRTGLKSRKAMSRWYQIVSQNDVMRREGVGGTVLTEGLLARFATLLQRGELQGIAEQRFGGDGATIVLDDNCLIM